LRAEASGKVKWIAWSFGDNTSTAGVNPASHAFETMGTFTVRVTVSNETHTATATTEITVVDYIVYASPTGGHVAPFASWADAATNLQAAVDAVTMLGGRVLATNGVYDVGARVAGGQTTTNRLVLDKAVRVESVNGPEATAIVGRWHSEATPLGVAAIRGVYIGGSALLCGFTVSNSATPGLMTANNGKGGGLFLAAGGVATNCVITNCRAWRGGGAASQVGATGELRGCVVSNNQAVAVSINAGQGGGVAWLNAQGCRIVSNTAGQGGGAYDCTLEACELLRNTATSQGGGAYDCTLEACELLRNTAATQGGGAFNGNLNRCRVRENSVVDTSSGAGGGRGFRCHTLLLPDRRQHGTAGRWCVWLDKHDGDVQLHRGEQHRHSHWHDGRRWRLLWKRHLLSRAKLYHLLQHDRQPQSQSLSRRGLLHLLMAPACGDGQP
jgi:PKD repeat protein